MEYSSSMQSFDLAVINAHQRRHIFGADDAFVYVVNGWMTAHDASKMFTCLSAADSWKQEYIHIAGKMTMEPRLSYAHGSVYEYSGVRRSPVPWTSEMASLVENVSCATGAKYNQVLVQKYRDGNDSIGWHADDEPELGTNPTIAAVSLGATRRILFRSKLGGKSTPIDLEHGSLMVMTGSTQNMCHHSISKTKSAVGARVSITMRMVICTMFCVAFLLSCSGCATAKSRLGPVVTEVINIDEGRIGVKSCVVEIEVETNFITYDTEITSHLEECKRKVVSTNPKAQAK